MKEMTHKIAIMEYIQGCLIGFRHITEHTEDTVEKVRVSEVLEITFKSRNTNEIVQSIIKSIDDEIEKLENKFLDEKLKLENQKKELLAITYSPE